MIKEIIKTIVISIIQRLNYTDLWEVLDSVCDRRVYGDGRTVWTIPEKINPEDDWGCPIEKHAGK